MDRELRHCRCCGERSRSQRRRLDDEIVHERGATHSSMSHRTSFHLVAELSSTRTDSAPTLGTCQDLGTVILRLVLSVPQTPAGALVDLVAALKIPDAAISDEDLAPSPVLHMKRFAGLV